MRHTFIPPLTAIPFMEVLGHHADTPITIKAEASSKADSRIH